MPGISSSLEGKQMINVRGQLARNTCPVCGGKQEVLTLPDCLEWDEKQGVWVPQAANICDTCGHTTLHTFHPEMFPTIATEDKNQDKNGQ
jgi:hypothetical protein